MKVQIASDLHIEYCYHEEEYLNLIKPSSKILILPGDIGSLYRIKQLGNYLNYLCNKFLLVIYVFGNCEFYLDKKYIYKFQEMDNLKNRIKDISKSLKNLIVLDQENIQIGEYLFTGCTLWSKLEKPLPYKYKIRDLDTEKYNELHQSDFQFIQKSDQFAKENNLKHIVITHYLPFILNNDKTKPDLYMTDLSEFIKDSNIHTWICGHIHQNFNLEIGKVNLVSNQKGKLKSICDDYKPDFIIDL